MTKTFLLALQESAKLCNDLNKLCSVVPSFEIVGVVENFPDAKLLLEKLPIDALIVEVRELSDYFLQQIEPIAQSCKSIIAVLTPIQDDIAMARMRKKGCHLIFRVPCDLEDVAEELYRSIYLRKKSAMPMSVRLPQDKPLDERLANIFIASGIPPHIKGYQFLREAVKLAVHTPSMINNITKQLYPTVARYYGTTPSKVERAIRHAIDVAWSRGKIDNINNVYGIKVFAKGERPTNGELIALISDKIIIEGIN